MSRCVLRLVTLVPCSNFSVHDTTVTGSRAPTERGGKPCIHGLGITVYDVLDYLAGGMSEQDILSDFPDLRPRTFAPVSPSQLIASASW